MSTFDIKLIYDDDDIPVTYRLDVLLAEGVSLNVSEMDWEGNPNDSGDDGIYRLSLFLSHIETEQSPGSCISSISMQGIDIEDEAQVIHIEILLDGEKIGGGTVKSVDAQQESRPGG